jgi:hypothetical protein
MLRIGGEVIYLFAGERGKEKGEGSQGPQGDWESVRQGGDDWMKSGVRESVRQRRSHR